MCFDGDPATIWREQTRKAAKPYRCDECGRGIAKGERYSCLTMLFDGHWDTFHTCRFCAAAARWLQLVCGGYGAGGLSEELHEHWAEDWLYRSHWLGRAIIGIHRQWAGFAEPLPDPAPMLARKGLAHYGRVAS